MASTSLGGTATLWPPLSFADVVARQPPSSSFGNVQVAPEQVDREDTCYFHVPDFPDGERKEVLKVGDTLYKAFHDTISCVQYYRDGRFSVIFTSKQSASVAEEKGLLIANKKIELKRVRKRSVRVLLKNAPFQLEHHVVAAALARYGKVIRIEHCYHPEPEMHGWANGDRKVEIEMKEAIPNFIRICGFTVMCIYAGVQKICRKCGQAGHFASNCPTKEACSNCGRFGHPAFLCDICDVCGERKNEWHMCEDDDEEDLHHDGEETSVLDHQVQNEPEPAVPDVPGDSDVASDADLQGDSEDEDAALELPSQPTLTPPDQSLSSSSPNKPITASLNVSTVSPSSKSVPVCSKNPLPTVSAPVTSSSDEEMDEQTDNTEKRKFLVSSSDTETRPRSGKDSGKRRKKKKKASKNKKNGTGQ